MFKDVDANLWKINILGHCAAIWCPRCVKVTPGWRQDAQNRAKEAIRSQLGTIFGLSWAILDASGSIVDPSGTILVPYWAYVWAHFGAIVGLFVVLDPCLAHLGPYGPILGPSGAHLGPSELIFGASELMLGPSGTILCEQPVGTDVFQQPLWEPMCFSKHCGNRCFSAEPMFLNNDNGNQLFLTLIMGADVCEQP
jgi:hypothetical protein